MANDSLNDFVTSDNPTHINESVPRIYVICLAAYNNGWLHGKWIDPTQEVHAIQKEIKKMLLDSPVVGAEKFGIHTFKGFGSLKINIFETIKSIQSMAVFINELGELGVELLVYYNDVDSAKNAWKNHYHGEHDNELEFAIQLFDELYMASIPETAQGYIDYAFFKRDIFIDDFFSLEVRGKTHVFAHNRDFGWSPQVIGK